MAENQKIGLEWLVSTVMDKQVFEIVREMARYRNIGMLKSKVESSIQNQASQLPKDLQVEYERQLPLLQQLLGKCPALNKGLVYHGTGFYKYSKIKYRSGSSEEGIEEVLPAILNSGIKPFYDPWLPGQEMQSTSYAKAYMYAKTYAMRFNSPGISTRWNYGEYQDWLMFYMTDMMKGLTTQAVASKLKGIFKPSEEKGVSINQTASVSNWVGSYISPRASSGMSMLELMKYSTTDIPNNWGAVFAIHEDKLQQVNAGLNLVHEVRATNPVSPEDIAFMSVPFDKIVVAMELVNQHNLKFPVFPMEVVDYYLANFPITELVART